MNWNAEFGDRTTQQESCAPAKFVIVVLVVVVVVVVGGTVVVVVTSTVVVVVSGAAKLSMSFENPKAACRPAAAPIPSGNVSAVSVSIPDGADVGAGASTNSELGEKAAKAAIARRAITTQVANASNRVNLTPANFRVLNKRPRCASMRGIA